MPAGPCLYSALAVMLALVVWVCFRARHRRRLPRYPEPVKSVSVVIPVRNEGSFIATCVRAARHDSAVAEILVVDGGSDDDTVARATSAGARVIVHSRPVEAGGGRGGQIHAGVEAATGDIVAIVHADTRLVAGALDRMVVDLNREPGVIGGALGCTFDGDGWRLRLLDLANHFRAAVLGIAFGDQVQFFRRLPVVEQDIYPNLPLMEDVELSLRLRALGCVSYGRGGARVSPRSWQSGAGRRAMLIITLVGRYLWLRRWGRADALQMYRQYYGG